jgi:hypothetical protein
MHGHVAGPRQRTARAELAGSKQRMSCAGHLRDEGSVGFELYFVVAEQMRPAAVDALKHWVVRYRGGRSRRVRSVPDVQLRTRDRNYDSRSPLTCAGYQGAHRIIRLIKAGANPPTLHASFRRQNR